MTEKNILLISEDNSINASASVTYEDSLPVLTIKGTLNIFPDAKEVLKAYMVKDDLSNKNLGVMEVQFEKVYLSLHLKSPSDIPKGIYITKKDTFTEEEQVIAYGGFCDDFSPYDITAYHNNKYNSIKKAETILEKIKNASETKDQGISKRNCINVIKRNLEGLPSKKHKFRMFDTFYKSETFFPIANLSSVKFVMSEGLCACSFFESGHYYLSLKDNILIIAFCEYNGQNPLNHIKEFSVMLEISSVKYYAVMIELSDEGQYFIL